jgi:ssDNA-binding Zn-finger/Zn-ribbon topoisomerase 1
MSPADKTLQCSDCGTSFTFSAEEQDFFATKGYTNEPKRCPGCRQAKRAQRNGSGGGGGGFGGSRSNRQMYSAGTIRAPRRQTRVLQPLLRQGEAEQSAIA